MTTYFLLSCKCAVVLGLAGCATAGSTISMVEDQSYILETELAKENRQRDALEREQKSIQAQISQLQKKRDHITQNPEVGAQTDLQAIKESIDRLKSRDAELSRMIAAVGT